MFPKLLEFLSGERSKLWWGTKHQGFPLYSSAEAADCGVAIPKLPLTRLPEHGSSSLCKHFAFQEEAQSRVLASGSLLPFSLVLGMFEIVIQAVELFAYLWV